MYYAEPIPDELYTVAGSYAAGVPSINAHAWRGHHAAIRVRRSWHEVILCVPLTYVDDDCQWLRTVCFIMSGNWQLQFDFGGS